MAGKGKNNFRKTFLIYLFLGFVAYMLADLSLLKIRAQFFPTYSSAGAPKLNRFRGGAVGNPDLESFKNYEVILSTNMFNSDGVIPPPLSTLKGEEQPTEEEQFNDPVLTNLPIRLEGTVVHRNPFRSLATIEASNKSLSYTVGDMIESLAEVVSVIRKKVIIRNKKNGKLEYVEIPRDLKLVKRTPPKRFTPIKKPSVKPTKSGIVKREGNSFSARRSDVEAQLSNIGSLLRQAKAERAVDPVTGEVLGFKLVQIKEGSIFEQLGVQVNDIISAVNGEPVTSPNKAMLMFNQLKSANQISISVERGGSKVDLDYNIED